MKELVEEEEQAGGQGQRAEEGGDAHAQGEAVVLAVAVDIEARAVVGEQALLVVVQAIALGGIEDEGAFVVQTVQLAVEGQDIVDAVLRLLVAEVGHDRSLRRVMPRL